MDLRYTPPQQAFRAEARAWLEANVPAEPLRSFDTPEGFEEHRRWERKLHAGGWAMVPWPVEYGGRGADLLEWLIFEEEYYRAGAPGRVNQNGIFLLVPLDAPGVTVRPIEKLNRKAAFAEVFFDGARVPVENRLGEEGQGWKVAMSTAGFERGLMLRSPARFQATTRRLVELYRDNEAACDPALRPTVIDCWMEAEAYTLDTYKTVSRLHSGGKIGFEASLNKIFWSELDLKMHETALAILGERAELRPEAPAAEGVGEWLDGYLFALAGPIYAGTNEIQRNVIAERILGLPRK